MLISNTRNIMRTVWELQSLRLTHSLPSSRTRGKTAYNQIYGEHKGKGILVSCSSQISNDDKQDH